MKDVLHREIEVVGKWMVIEGISTVGFAIPTQLLKIADEMREKAKDIKEAPARKLILENANKVAWTGLLLGSSSGEVMKQLQDHLVAHKLMED